MGWLSLLDEVLKPKDAWEKVDKKTYVSKKKAKEKRSKLTGEPMSRIPRIRVEPRNGGILVEGKYGGQHIRDIIRGLDVEKLGIEGAIKKFVEDTLVNKYGNMNRYYFVLRVMSKHLNEIINTIKNEQSFVRWD